MASLSVFDNDRSPTPDFFYRLSKDPLEFPEPGVGTKVFARSKQLIDYDLDNYRNGLWSFGDFGDSSKDYSDNGHDQVPVGINNGTSSNEATKPALQRWNCRQTRGTHPRMSVQRPHRLEQAPSDEQVYDGYKVWNVNTPPRQSNSAEMRSTRDGVQDITASPDKKAHASMFAAGTDTHETISPPLQTPLIDARIGQSSASSFLTDEFVPEDENISEDHRRSVARKQYYEHRGILWDIATALLEPWSLHPTNLTEYEFTKLVCFQGYHQISQWLTSNYPYLVDRINVQWHQANSLLKNNANLEGLNANFMNDFVWMDADDQVSFIRSYRRLQLEAMALRSGLRLPTTELDDLCTATDEYKLEIIELYKNEAVQASLQRLRSLCSEYSEVQESSEEVKPGKADNLHLKFLWGLGQEKGATFQDLIGVNKKSFTAKESQLASKITREAEEAQETLVKLEKEVETNLNSAHDTASVTNISARSKIKWDLNVVQRTSDDSNNSSEASEFHSAPAHSAVDGTRIVDLAVHDTFSEHIEDIDHVPAASSDSQAETSYSDNTDLPQLKRHKVSYNDLRGLASQACLESANCVNNEYFDEGSDCEFSPSKSLRSKATKLFGAFKKPLTWASRGRRSRRTIQDWFD